MNYLDSASVESILPEYKFASVVNAILHGKGKSQGGINLPELRILVSKIDPAQSVSSRKDIISFRSNYLPPSIQDAPDISAITNFWKKSVRVENDVANKVREQVLMDIGKCRIPSTYYTNQEYGKLWTYLREEWTYIIKCITGEEAYSLEARGGRANTYDFHLVYGSTIVKLEFKYGACIIEDLPQFIQLDDRRSSLIVESYSKYFYDNHLDDIITDLSIIAPKPNIDEYIKRVSDTIPKTAFFRELKEKQRETSKQITRTSIREYLRKHASCINIGKFVDKMRDSQSGKMYILWHHGRFNMDEISELDITNLKYVGVRNGNTIELIAGTTRYDLLLRWKNGIGVLKPAWQIRIRRQL